jgi:hypothetical protein
MGLAAGMNPLMLATAMLFIWLLSVYRHTRAQLIAVGSCYLGIVWLVSFMVLNGNYDHLIYLAHVERLIGIFYWVLAVLYLYLGFVHFNDWLLLRRGRDVPMLGLPSPRTIDLSPRTGRWYRHFYLVFIFTVIAWHIALFESSLTQNYYLFVVMFEYLKADAALARAITAFLAYMISYTSLLWLAWAVCLIDGSSMRVRSYLNRHLAMEKLVLSALFWSTSVGLVFYLLNIRR